MAKIRAIIPAVLVLCLSGVSGFADSVYVYTVDMTEAHTVSISSSPYVTKTPSGNSSLALGGTPAEIEDFVIGTTPGNTNPSYDYIPPHNLYAYKITDPCVTGPKTKVVIATGNHNTETSGGWAFQGMVDFLLSGEPEAVWLRKAAEFWVYPLVNPDGRYTAEGRGNPEIYEMFDAGQLPDDDHNRLWHLSYPTDCGVSTIDALTSAMQNDTDSNLGFLFDFHTTGAGNPQVWVKSSMANSPYILALMALGTDITIHITEGVDGMLRIWSLTPWGLNAEYAFTSESDNNGDVPYYLDIGRSYGLALHNVLMPETLIRFADLEVLSSDWLVTNYHQRQIGELIGWWEFDEGDGNTAADSSGYDNTGTLYDGNGNVIEDPNWQSGALAFDANTYVQTADNANKLQLTGSYTLSVWLKADAAQNEWAGILAKCAADTGSGNHWSLLFGGLGVPDTTGKLAVWNGASPTRWDTQIELSDIAGQWHHIAVVRSQNIMTSYLDGNQVNCDMCDANPADGDGHLNIGTERTIHSHYKGMIDDIRIYDWPLSPDEVELLYEGSPLPPTPPETICVGYLKSDLNEDCNVNFLDFSTLALEWLESSIK